jgi:DNA repair protein SbcC/Rad50
MRPLRLSIRGLRSYRGECSIDFADRSLVAIIGDTGAGKSSILEAITYALYNSTTWTAGEVKPLIADGVQTMSVQLEFWAEGKRWKVHRSTSRGAHPPPLHQIECLDDPDWQPVTGEELVRRQVQKLLGMNRKAFLSAVILPQSRFQALLQEEAAERTRILKGIFRLTELEAVREQADLLRRRAEPALERLRGRRVTLLPDPAAEAARVERALAKVAARERRLRGLETSAREAERIAREAAARVEALEQPARHLGALLAALERKPPAPILRALADRAADLGRRLAELEASRGELEAKERAVAARLAEGDDFQRLVEAEQTLARAARDCAEIERTRARLAAERARLAASRARLATRAASLQRMAARAEAARRRRDTVAEELERRRRVTARARELVLEAEQRAHARAELAQEQAALRRQLRTERTRLRRLEESSTVTIAARSQAEQDLERVRAAHAAAHAAHGLGEGDPCPVCRTPLPVGFEVPPAPALEPARDRLRKLTALVEQQATQLADARAAVGARGADLERMAGKLHGATARAAPALVELRALVPGADPDPLVVDALSREDRRLEEELADLAERAEKAREAHQEAAAAHHLRGQELDRRDREAARAEADAGERMSECRNALLVLPAFVPVPDELTAAGLRPARDLVAERLEAARADLDEREKLLGQLHEVRGRLEDLTARRDREVERPGHAQRLRLLELSSELDAALRALGRPRRRARTMPEQPRELADWGCALQEAASRAALGWLESAATLRARADAKQGRVRARLERAGIADLKQLGEALHQAQREAGGLEIQLAQAREQIGFAAELDRRIEVGADVAGSLRELCRLLGDGQFVGHVIEQRQRLLLGVASETLGAMTGGRYGFSGDFLVIDGLSGQPRSPKTLSGGEAFLAALALALALVEIASRAGGRLDALFLDEGFGSLDANALDDALGALERRATQGRLVAVVSHIAAVAERIESVLEVTRRPAGSVATWRDGRARDALVQRELEGHLLT